MRLFAKVRGMFAGYYAEGRENQQIEMNNRGDLLVAQSLPERTEIVRMGSSYHVMGTAVASVTAVPTTAAHFSLYNGEADGGKCYVIDSVHALYTVNSGAALVHNGIIGQLTQGRIATAPTDGGFTFRRLHGAPKGNTKALACVSNTLPANLGWWPIGNSINSAVNALPGFQIDTPCYGLYIVPPGGMFSLATLGSVTTSSAILGVRWHEVLLDLAS